MPPLKAGDKFPDGVVFSYAPIENDDAKACSMPAPFKASEEFKGKKVVIVSVPGAFTPGCQAFHVPPYIENLNKI
ncbi:hypothetical protein KC346_g3694, partial [Hortaea werneckii]